MNFPNNRRSRHHTAFVVLFVWLFALAAGVANACLLEEPGTHGHDAHAAAESDGHAGAVASHDHGDSHGAKSDCVKFCSDSAHSPTSPDLKVVQADIGLAPLVTLLWNSAEPIDAAPRHGIADPPPAAGPPIRVRFSRLAL
jgi:hypothetical protein